MEEAIIQICQILIFAALEGDGWIPPFNRDLVNAARDILGLKAQPPDAFDLRWLACNLKVLEARAAAAGFDPDSREMLDKRKFRQALYAAKKEHEERKAQNAARVKAWNEKHA